MASTVWKGHLTFGLVSIPVRLFRAARAERVRLHQLYRPARQPAPPPVPVPQRDAPVPKTKPTPPQPEAAIEPEPEPVARIRQAAIAPDDNHPIAKTDLVKGYEYSRDRYVVLDEEDIRKITPQTVGEMQIIEFVRFDEIDPVYLETSYYLAPDEAGKKAYALLYEGMRETGYAALAQVAMHRREHVMILRPGKTGIVTHTMFYPDEVRTTLEFRTIAASVQPKELDLSKMLIHTLAVPFDPSKFKDTYRERLQELIEAKLAGREIAHAEAPQAAKVVDIMEALQKSIAAASKATANDRKPAAKERPAAKKRGSRRVS